MNNSFLNTFEKRILERDIPLQNQIAVLPTRRAASFLKKALSQSLEGTSWLPEFTTFNAWMEEISGLRSVDSLHLKFVCFEAYRKVMGASAQDVSGFFSWADVVLGDFNDIEAYMVSPSAIFKELKDYTDIAHFSFLDDPLSQKQLNYQKFWNALPKIHSALNEALLAEGLGYPGLIARKAAENWDNWISNKDEFFATIGGFNAISAAESSLLTKAQNSGKAEVLFDVDAFYFNQKANHAGIFLRKNTAAKLGKNVFTSPSLAERPIRIHIGEASSRARQVSIISALLSEIPETDLSETAVVLADESLLIPLLNRLPESITSSNITMGIGLRDTIFADWLRTIWESHETGMYTEGQFLFSAEHVKKVLLHPVSRLLDEKSANAGKLHIPAHAKFISARQLAKDASSANILWLAPLLEPWNHSSAIAGQSILTALDEMENILKRKGSSGYALRIIGASLILLRRALRKMLAIDGFADLRPASTLTLLLRELGGGSLALIGEPLEGLQIMGLLETRALAFKNVVLCSANEDILPHKARIDSFIPFEIRQYHHLPGKREKEAVYAYHFYRLLQHAEQAYLVYSSDSQDQKGNEKSRYLHQIAYDLAAENPSVQLIPFGLEPDPLEILESRLEIEKTEEVLENIRNIIEIKLSASSINRYLDSPLEWYYSYVLKLREPDNKDELDPATFGTIVHESLENLKKPFLNNPLTAPMLKEMIGGSKAEVKRQFESNPLSRHHDTGLNRIHFEVATKMVRRYLKSEKALVEAGENIVYLASEIELERKLTVESYGREITAVFKGYADSIERRDGNIHIVDYKTGNVKSTDLSMTSFEMEKAAKNPKAFQLLLYSWMGKVKYPGEEIRSQIIAMPTPSNRALMPKADINSPEGEAAFEEMLASIIHHMLDSRIPISASEEYKYAVFE